MDKKRLKTYLQNKTVNNIYKILPLYEENNLELNIYINSLINELNGVENLVNIENEDYVSLLAVLENLLKEITLIDNKKTIKREVFKAIKLAKETSNKLVI